MHKNIGILKQFISWLCVIIMNSGVNAQDVVSLKVDHLSTNTGLSSTFVRKTVQDPFGFMWIGTQDGLNRYDGKNFISYKKESITKHAITGEDIRDLLLDTLNHSIWSISSFGGIDQIDYYTGNVIYQYSQSASGSTRNILFTSLSIYAGKLFIGSSNGLFTLDIKKKRIARVSQGQSLTNSSGSLEIDRILLDGMNNLWIFCRGGTISVFEQITKSDYSVITQNRFKAGTDSDFRFFDACVISDDSILCATSMGLKLAVRNSSGQLSVVDNPYPAVLISQKRDIYSCQLDRNKNIWFCCSNFLLKLDRKTGRLFNIRENTSRDELNWLSAIYDIYFDLENNIWLGCQQGVAFANNQPAKFIRFNKSAVSEEMIKHAYYIYPANDSIIYCCSQYGLYRVNIKSDVIVALDDKKPYYHVFKDHRNMLVGSSIEGTFVFNERKVIPLGSVYKEFASLGKIVFNSHCYKGDSIVILGTENFKGIVIWNYKSRTSEIISAGTKYLRLAENIVNTVYKDTKDRIWVLGDQTISLLDIDKQKTTQIAISDHTKTKNYSIFFDVCEVNGFFYVASYGSGIIVYDSTLHLVKEISSGNGLSSNTIYKIIPYKDSLLFVTSNNGLTVIDIRNNFTVKSYYESDGLHSNSFEENSGVSYHDYIYAGGEKGLTLINVLLLAADSLPPKIYINSVKLETKRGSVDSSNIFLSLVQIPNDILQAKISFSAINYTNPERTTFLYRIKELNSSWIDLGGQNFLTLIGLNPGSYTLLVRAAGPDGLFGETKTGLTLVYIPKWFQTIWFKAALLIAIMGVLYIFYAYRIRQIKNQQEIRKNIASDLHDDIGSTLNSVKIFTHLVRKEPGKPDLLNQIEESLSQASVGLRDLIWVLDDTQDSFFELIERIKKFAYPVCAAKNIVLETFLDGELNKKKMSKTEKRNLLLISKEAITNSLKYSNCSRININFSLHSSKIRIRIIDNGEGFDFRKHSEGYGLRNIKQRAAQIRYYISIVSDTRSGTMIELIKIK